MEISFNQMPILSIILCIPVYVYINLCSPIKAPKNTNSQSLLTLLILVSVSGGRLSNTMFYVEEILK